MEAWKAGELEYLSVDLRMNFYRPPREHPPHYTLRIEGYSGGETTTEEIASLFRPYVWKIYYRASSPASFTP